MKTSASLTSIRHPAERLLGYRRGQPGRRRQWWQEKRVSDGRRTKGKRGGRNKASCWLLTALLYFVSSVRRRREQRRKLQKKKWRWTSNSDCNVSVNYQRSFSLRAVCLFRSMLMKTLSMKRKRSFLKEMKVSPRLSPSPHFKFSREDVTLKWQEN